MTEEKRYNSIPIPKDVSERPSEDDLAREALGGVKGSPDLSPAPLTKKEKEQEPIKDQPEHPG